MFYLGIDQHRKQLTVCLRDAGGNVVLRRQVSTEWQRVREFLREVDLEEHSLEIRPQFAGSGVVALALAYGARDPHLARQFDDTHGPAGGFAVGAGVKLMGVCVPGAVD